MGKSNILLLYCYFFHAYWPCTHTHTYTHTRVCLCVCVFELLMSSAHFLLPLETYMLMVNSYNGSELINKMLLPNLRLELMLAGWKSQYGGKGENFKSLYTSGKPLLLLNNNYAIKGL